MEHVCAHAEPQRANLTSPRAEEYEPKLRMSGNGTRVRAHGLPAANLGPVTCDRSPSLDCAPRPPPSAACIAPRHQRGQSVERRQFLLGQAELGGVEVLVQVRAPPRSRDGYDISRPAPMPTRARPARA